VRRRNGSLLVVGEVRKTRGGRTDKERRKGIKIIIFFLN
jgi:hypothetical protein